MDGEEWQWIETRNNSQLSTLNSADLQRELSWAITSQTRNMVWLEFSQIVVVSCMLAQLRVFHQLFVNLFLIWAHTYCKERRFITKSQEMKRMAFKVNEIEAFNNGCRKDQWKMIYKNKVLKIAYTKLNRCCCCCRWAPVRRAICLWQQAAHATKLRIIVYFNFKNFSRT